MKTKIIILALALGASSACWLNAQDNNPPAAGQNEPRRQGGAGGPGGMGQRPVSPIIEALDLNHDGTIDAD